MKDSKLLWGEREGWALVGAMPPLPQPLTFVATSWMVQFSSLMCSWINVIIWAFAYLCTYPLSPSPPLPLVISRLLWGRCAVAQVLILIRLLTEKLWLEGKKNRILLYKKVWTVYCTFAGGVFIHGQIDIFLSSCLCMYIRNRRSQYLLNYWLQIFLLSLTLLLF